MPALKPYIVKSFTKGLITRIEGESIPRGASSDSLNWLTLGDHIELRRGITLLGTENTDANGRITGLEVGKRFDGEESLMISHTRSIKYYDDDSEDFVEVSTANVYQKLRVVKIFLSQPIIP